jgi:hypothetical protein
MLAGTNGFVSWKDVTSDIVEGQKATFYYVPSELIRGWAGNAQRMEVKSFRAGRVSSARNKSAKVYVEFVQRGARNHREGVQTSRPNLVILDGWQHPDPPPGWVSDGTGGYTTRWSLGAPEWRAEMDAFLSAYLREHPAIRVLADFREDSESPPSPRLPRNVGQEDVSTIPETIDKSSPPLDAGSFISADDVRFHGQLVEGAVKSVLVNAYERNAEARRRCIEHYGPQCSVCNFDFGEVYGNAVRGYIHVHHLKALSEIAAEYVIDPIADLRPICPNCHAVIHSHEVPYTLDEVRELIAAGRL